MKWTNVQCELDFCCQASKQCFLLKTTACHDENDADESDELNQNSKIVGWKIETVGPKMLKPSIRLHITHSKWEIRHKIIIHLLFMDKLC